MRSLRLVVVTLSLLLVIMVAFSNPAFAAPPAAGNGVVTIITNTPDGVPGLTELTTTGGRVVGVAGKAGSGTTASVDVSVPSGTYKVEPRPVMADGLRYIGISASNTINVSAGSKRTVTVRYGLSEGLQHLEVSDLSATRIALAWQLPAGRSVLVRRTQGLQVATLPSQGTPVSTSGSALVDPGLTPGTQYNYSFWVRPGDSAFGVTQSNGPVVFSVGTPDPTDSSKATYAVTPGTRILTSGDVSAADTTGSGVNLTLASGVTTPVPGAAVVLPRSGALRGGYLGVVGSVSTDGRTLSLRPGGLGDAFDFYGIDVPDLSVLPDQTSAGPAATGGSALSQSPSNAAKQQKARASRKSTMKTSSPSSLKSSLVANSTSSSGLTSPAVPECGPSGGVEAVDFHPSFAMGGHFSVYMTKKKVAWWEVPSGVTWDVEQVVTVSGAVKVDVNAKYGCEVKVNPIVKTLPTEPVPMAVYLKPTVEVGVGGLLKISNVGVALTMGFSTQGHIGFDGGNDLSGKRISTATPLTPVYDAGGIAVTAKVAAALLIGPGAGTEKAGVIVGIGGELSPLTLTVSGTLPLTAGGSPCFTTDAHFTVGIVVSARAWLGPISFDGTFPIPYLSGDFPYPLTPFHIPDHCDEIVAPPDSIIGSGVTKVGDSVTGSPDQMGYVDGFVPGSKTWVLSTGKISDALGMPSFFASTALGEPGDADLSALSGHPTYDAAAYTVTVVPTGHQLKVKYVFASEEYPEFVGSNYNDVMAVFVNGKNCALVPGTTKPVSINTINASTNANYYVDNQTGASGYGTTYDGLTKPLVCSAPVTPGVPVTVRIAVADASDAIYDSGVALLDQGIWSE